MTTNVQVTHADSARSVWVVRDKMRFMGEVAGTNLAIVEADVPPGSGTPPHQHASLEIFRVLSGEITFGVFGDGEPQMITAGPGAVVTIPSMAPHNYQNLSDEPASMMIVLESQMIGLFEDLGQTETPSGPPTDAEIENIFQACERHGVYMFVGAPA